MPWASDYTRSQTGALFFTGTNCDGTAYILGPETVPRTLSEMRGSSYELGPDAGVGGATPARIYRSKDGETPTDNSGIVQSAWLISDFSQGAGPQCVPSNSAGFLTVLAEPVTVLDTFIGNLVANPPYTVE